MCMPAGYFLDAGQNGTLNHLLTQWKPVRKEIKFTGFGMNDQPDPDIGATDMQLYQREPNIESYMVRTSSHCGMGVTIQGYLE